MSDTDRYRDILLGRLQKLEDDDAARASDRAPVTLDQQAVGRLSRMDAMQQQAMAQAQSRRRGTEIQRLKSALARLETDAFGACLDCGDDIDPDRLALDPAMTLCRSCIEDRR